MSCIIWFVCADLAPPSRVREGVVTDSSIELLWDPAQGHAQSYEVICFNCEHPFMVNKPKTLSLDESYTAFDSLCVVRKIV